MRIAFAVILSPLLIATLNAQSISSARFVNGIAVSGAATDLSDGTRERLGFFSDLAYDAARGEWWGLSDRGPGGGVLNFETRAHRFTIDVNRTTGRISNFRLLETIRFRDSTRVLNGLAPNPPHILGQSLDPEGLAIIPSNGHLLVSDEYGPSLIEFDRKGNLVRRFTTPANIVPRNSQSGVPNFASGDGNDAGRAANRGFEALAISHDERFAYAVLENAMRDEGASNGPYSRIVEFDLQSAVATRQFAYPLKSPFKGQSITAMTSVGPGRFLVLERDNDGVGVGTSIAPVDKTVTAIDLANATDISQQVLTNGALPAGVKPVSKSTPVIDLDANTLAPLGAKSPQKWEGIAIGPTLRNGDVLILASTDNDFSVTQISGGTQFDVWFDFKLRDPYAVSIWCPIGQNTKCFTGEARQAQKLTSAYALLPGVLHAYRARVVKPTAPTPAPLRHQDHRGSAPVQPGPSTHRH